MPFRSLSAVLLMLLAGLSMACAKQTAGQPEGVPEPQASLPAGTVFLVDGRPITRSEIEQHVPGVARIEPDETIHSWRRKALTNIVLPRAMAAVMVPRERDDARERAQAGHLKLLSGDQLPVQGPQLERVTGIFSDVGQDLWNLAFEMSEGQWSEPLETVAGYWVFRVLEKPEPPWLPNAQITVERVFWPYLKVDNPREFIGSARGQVSIEVVDAEWERYLPTWWRFPDRESR